MPWSFRVLRGFTNNTFSILIALLYATTQERLHGAPIYLAIALGLDLLNRRNLNKLFFEREDGFAYGGIPTIKSHPEIDSLHWRAILGGTLVLFCAGEFMLYLWRHLSDTPFAPIALAGFSTQHLNDIVLVLPAFQIFRSLAWIATTIASVLLAKRCIALFANSPFVLDGWRRRGFRFVSLTAIFIVLVVAFLFLWGWNMGPSTSRWFRSLTPAQGLFFHVTICSAAFAYYYSMMNLMLCQYQLDVFVRRKIG